MFPDLIKDGWKVQGYGRGSSTKPPPGCRGWWLFLGAVLAQQVGYGGVALLE